MSVKKSMDKTVAALGKGKTKIVRLYDFMSGLSVKNKACFDIQLKSDKSFMPLCRHGFSYNKEFRIMPIIWCITGIVAVCTVIKTAFNRH